ncbi:class I SAM-dependent DNA methyltransferase [Evansella cellulosilytica]|uniref:Methyltransferase type 12 n=1 Tax=Evansella cellulosilytica (strain ATCC 21833 / DSM 2522 / FERM P-1141 / JCM 9156 / N-4) TaxID=649639 RepID=E6TWK0_EVAC2|nr:class I SAM-dependent methyltransferase [Evansella cellulosilytica]ADU32263.1 Methyltransferase type 12 [Evansella cellulosilytica DSM 2522]
MTEKTTLSNFEEYENPTIYDVENNTYMDDVKFLEKWAAQTEGVIIDLACGTGRATIPLAAKGYRLIGVDVHQGMLQEAVKKSNDLDLQIEWVKQDCTRLKLNVKSNLIYCVGNSFQHFLTNEDQDNLLTGVYKHLSEDGVFIFGTRFPNEKELLVENELEYWKTYIDDRSENKVDVYTISSYDSLKQVQHNTTIRKYIYNNDVVDELKTNISLRYVFPQEMERTLTSNGLKIVNVFQDWNGTTITNQSNQMIYICKKG